MSGSRYQVIYKGALRDGFDRTQALKQAAVILSLSEEEAGQILNGRRVVLKRGLDEATARDQCIRLKKAGFQVALGVPQGPAPGAATPPGAVAPLAAPQPEIPPRAAGRAAPAPQPATTRIPFEFTGSGAEYFRIWVVNLLLSIVTLGVYSAWAKVRRKQYFYGNTVVGDASFDYLGDPLKILKGRLIVGGAVVAGRCLGRVLPPAPDPPHARVRAADPLADRALADVQRAQQRLAQHPLRLQRQHMGGLQGVRALAAADDRDPGPALPLRLLPPEEIPG